MPRAGGRNQAWARLEVWARLATQVGSTVEGMIDDTSTFDEASRRRIELASKQVQKTIDRMVAKMQARHDAHDSRAGRRTAKSE